jgi:hypothetical protein
MARADEPAEPTADGGRNVGLKKLIVVERGHSG